MKQRAWCLCALTVLCILSLGLSGCGEKKAEKPLVPRQTQLTFLVPENPREVVYENEVASIDASRTEDGYVLVRYSGTAAKIKLQITIPAGTVYTYSLKPGEYQVFPLSGGNGSYCIDVYENAYDKMYALVFSQKLDVRLSDPLRPYLYPNQYVWYTESSSVCSKSVSLSNRSSSDLDYVAVVYDYIIHNITYDDGLAENVPTGYLPDVDHTLAVGTGICFDYASLMTALLRAQGIPTKLIVGYSGEQYHAWISVYLEETGWVDGIIYFDGKSWSMMDPTLGANARSSKVKKYLGDGSRYLEKYHY